MTATKKTSMPYIKATKQLDITRRVTAEMDTAELFRLLNESKKSVHETKTLPSMQAVRP